MPMGAVRDVLVRYHYQQPGLAMQAKFTQGRCMHLLKGTESLLVCVHTLARQATCKECEVRSAPASMRSHRTELLNLALCHDS